MRRRCRQTPPPHLKGMIGHFLTRLNPITPKPYIQVSLNVVKVYLMSALVSVMTKSVHLMVYFVIGGFIVKNSTAYMPDENIVVSLEVTAEQPFNKCFECHSFRNGCSGPNLTTMSVPQVCEFLQLVRAFRDVTYQDIAEATGVSLAAVKRILTGKISDPSFYNIAAISSYLVGDPKGKYPCAIPNVVSDIDNETKLNDALRELERTLHDNNDYRVALDNIHIAYKVEMDAIRKEAQEQKAAMIKQIEAVMKDAQEQKAALMKEVERAREEADNWRFENERKGKLIDKYLDKMISK